VHGCRILEESEPPWLVTAEPSQKFMIDSVETFASLDEFTHPLIQIRRAGTGIHAKSSRREQIGKDEAVAFYDFAAAHVNGRAEHGARAGKRVKFAILAARVDR
jgi:hypothetical protein